MTDELKAMLKAAKTEEEAKEILLANKNELTEEEIGQISGGVMGIVGMGLKDVVEEEGIMQLLSNWR